LSIGAHIGEVVQPLGQRLQEMSIGTKGRITAYPLSRKQVRLGNLMNQFQSDLNLGLKSQILGHQVVFSSLRIFRRKPDLWHIEPACKQPITFIAGVAQKDTGLTVFHLTDGPTILPGNPNGLFALFDKLGTVHTDHALGIGDQRRKQELMFQLHPFMIPVVGFHKPLQGPNVLLSQEFESDGFCGLGRQIAHQPGQIGQA
jgi:hypothetical protein